MDELFRAYLRDYLRSNIHWHDEVFNSISEQEFEQCGNSAQVEISIEGCEICTE
jgi:hypothetical protein